MFAVLKTGGKQYKVVKDDLITIEKLESQVGDKFEFNEILMLVSGSDIQLGAPTIAGVTVIGEVIEQKRGIKTINYKKRRRKSSSARKKGHRQYLTVVKVADILVAGGSAAPKKKATKPATDAA